MVFIGNIIKKEESMVSKIYWLYKKKRRRRYGWYIGNIKKKKVELWLVKFIGNVKIKKEEDEWRRNSLKTF